MQRVNPAEFWRGRHVQYASELTPEIERNAQRVMSCVELFWFLSPFSAEAITVTSGWRPVLVNAQTPGAAKRSRHMDGLAIDVADDSGAIGRFVQSEEGLKLLEKCSLWCESPAYTKRWVHFQVVPPRSGKRIFIP